MSLIDSHGRKITYLRLAVTDRCNLRCTYCMPAYGISFVERKELLTYEEMLKLLNILADLGIEKIRITGGEPFVRKGVMDFIENIHSLNRFSEINLTTNATLTEPFADRFASAGIRNVNISLDTLDRKRFLQISRRDELENVLTCMHTFKSLGIKMKVNMVVMAGVNEEDIIPMAQLARDGFADVRFLEEMPFNGIGEEKQHFLNYRKIENILQEEFGNLEPVISKPGDTSKRFRVNGFKGKLGIIASYSRTFCGSCNRLRITPTGDLRTCLYADSSLNLRDLLRSGASDFEIADAIRFAVSKKPVDGFEAEKLRSHQVEESMATIGG
ncbi:MAG: GTP 3',8-cyclase MoaA [Bacteroidetes bacterium]|nr:GTP 3',8-cyclase MoaA [Bacteroidota bacterium]